MTNQYGLDAHYFKVKLELILRDLSRYTPEELSRDLSRLAETSYQTVATNIRSRLTAFADAKYIRALQLAQTTPCLGWEHKVKTNQFGLVEYAAHKQMNEAFGAHYGIYAAIKEQA